MSKVYSLRTVQKIPVTLEEAWAFFSTPNNLQEICPANIRFSIVSKHHGEEMYPGQIIEYVVKPFLGVRFYWMTEITHVKPMQYFTDEQRYGPYRLWHHQHHFVAIEGGVEMIDIVHYKLPLFLLGDLAQHIFIKNELKRIFTYRYDAVVNRYGKWHEPEECQISFK